MFKKTFGRVELMRNAMDAAWLRNETISNNIANVDTPNYKRQVVSFEKILKQQLDIEKGVGIRRTHINHMPVLGPAGLEPKIQTVFQTNFRMDKNNVNIDLEMSELAKNQVRYMAMKDQINSQVSRLKLAMKGGR